MYYWEDFIDEIQTNLKSGDVLLDAGAGSGHWKSYFSDSIKYIGMDLGVGDSAVDYSTLDLKGDLKNIPLENNSVDVIISIQVLEHCPEPWLVIQEFNRVLKPSGLLFFSVPQAVEEHQVPYDFFRYTSFGLKSLLESSKFELISIKPQLGNFSKIVSDVCYSMNKLPSIGRNTIEILVLSFISFYIRQVMWRIHRPFFVKYLDPLKIFQDNSTGYFVKAIKIKD